MKTGLLFAPAWMILFLALPSSGAAAPNDNFVNRIAVAGLTNTVTGDNVAATREAGEPPTHAGNVGGKSVWWTWTAPADGMVTMDTLGSSFDTLLAVYTGVVVSSLSQVASNDDGFPTNLNSRVTFMATAGTTYQIAVDGYNAASGSIVLNIRQTPVPPSNDDFANRIAVAGLTNTVTGDNVAATREAGEPPTHAGNVGGKSVWWTWTAPADGMVTMDTLGSSFDTLLAVYTGSAVSSLSQVASNDDGFPTNLNSRVTFMATAGTIYQIAVDGYNAASGSIMLNIRQTSVLPPNDDFINRIAVAGLTNTVTGDNVAATREAGEPPTHAGNVGGKSVWWTWTAPADGMVTIDTLGSSFDTLLAVYTGVVVSSLSQVASNDDGFPTNLNSRVTFMATAGTIYQIAVDGYNAASGSIMLNVRQTPVPPPNDNFDNRIAVAGLTNTVTGDNVAATREAGEPPTHAGNVGGKSVWWTWTAPADGMVTMDTLGSSFDTLLAVYTGVVVSNLSQVASNDDGFPTNLNSRVTFTGTAGTIYQIAVDGYNAASGSIMLNIRLTSVPPLITTQPQTQVVMIGDEVTLSVVATGTPPLSYQWRQFFSFGFELDIACANRATLIIHNIQPENAGTYGVVVSDASGSIISSNAVLTVLVPPPENDDFADRLTIPGAVAFVTGQNREATHEAGEPPELDGAGSVWWTWTAPASGPVALDTTGTGFDTILAVYTGTLSNLTVVATNRLPFTGFSGERGRSRLGFYAVAGTEYQIAVDGQTNAGSGIGAIVLSLRTGPILANDMFADRFVVAQVPGVVTGNNLHATREVGEPNHRGEDQGRSVWWTWTAPTTRQVVIDTAGGSFPRLAVYTGITLSNLTLVGDDQFRPASKVSFVAQAGTAYQIAADENPLTDGRIVLNFRETPSNDSFNNRSTIPGPMATVVGNVLGASSEAGEPDHAGSAARGSIWWKWTAPSSGVVSVDASGSAFYARLAVYKGNALPNLIPVASGEGQPVRVASFAAVAGTEYQIAVDDEPTDGGAVTLNLRTVLPASDAFASRMAIVGSGNTVYGHNVGASKEPGEPNHAGNSGGASVWWKWMATSSGAVTLDTFGSSFDTLLAVYTGNAVAGLTPVASDDGNSGFGQASFSFAAVAGMEYQIAVDGFDGANGTIALNLQPSPANDAFANAIPISGTSNLLSGSTLGATTEPNEPFENLGSSVWWSYVPQADGVISIDVPNGASTAFAVYQGQVISNLTRLADNLVREPPGGRTCHLTAGVEAGNVYYLSASSDLGKDLTFSVTFSPAPANDDFADRILINDTAFVFSSTTFGAGREADDPTFGTGSVWWSWTPTNSGPVILTTFGSAANTYLWVYTGSTLSNLSLVACNDDAYDWKTSSGPRTDPISRLRFDSIAGTTYQIAVASFGAAGPVFLNFEPLAIEDIVGLQRTLHPDRTLDFSADLLIANLNPIPTGPLRIRLFARAGHTYIQALGLSICGLNLPDLDFLDQELGAVPLPSPANLGSNSSVVATVAGLCPPPFETDGLGVGWGVIAVLEEQQSGNWAARDERLIVNGSWPRVGGFTGPGGGVITVASSLASSAPQPEILNVQLGPPIAINLGAAWRVSPTNRGELHEYYTSYTSNALYRLPVRGTNFSIEAREASGFVTPANHAVVILPGGPNVLDLFYSVIPPLLSFDAFNGTRVSGTVGTRYRIEYRSDLSVNGFWLPWLTNTIISSPSVLAIPIDPSVPQRFLRAVWLPD